jgi:hypothetical protein
MGSEGGRKRHLKDIRVVVETQMAPVEEPWHHWVEDFPLWRDNIPV